MTTTTEPPRDATFWTLKEAAADLRVSTQTLRKAIAAGSLPAKRVGRSYRLKPADVAEYSNTLPDA